MTRNFAVLDRDGTIIVERHYLSDPRQVELIHGAARGMREMSKMGLGLVVVTNQSAIGRGILDMSHLDLIHKRMCELLAAEGVHIDGIYFCPHMPEDDCLCRKPKPGLLELAAKELELDPHSSFVIGDKQCDVELGQRVGATTLLVRTGFGAQVAEDGIVTPDYMVDDLQDAAQVIHRLLSTGDRMVKNATR